MPVKSTSSESSATVTRQATAIGSSVATPSSMRTVAEEVPVPSPRTDALMQASPWSRTASQRSPNGSGPYRRTSSRTRRSPVRHPAICARRSPSDASGTRTFAASIANASAFSTPSLTIFMGGKIRPSPNTSVLSGTVVHGLLPPMSTWCAMVEASATSLPAANTGVNITMSGVWVQPR